ncbi:MAG TPA: lytic murein transglycosylase [Candidatus Andersenbacteria bacterium]|nr:lytic murein transglycosylase [Candidatus Andersenbacteria bacterium]
MLTTVGVFPYSVGAAPTTIDYSNQISEKQQEIDALNKKINDLSHKRSQTASEAEQIAITLEQLKADLLRANAQLSKTQATITDVKAKSQDTSTKVKDLESSIDEKKKELDSLVRQLYEFEQVSLVQVFFDSQSLSDVMSQRDAYKSLQERAVGLLTDMHQKEAELVDQKNTLDQQASDLTQLQVLQDAQAQDLADKKSAQKQFLQQKQQEQAQYESLIAEAQQARDEIKRQVFTLQNGNIKISLSTANDMARFAGKVTGVRPALIMAVLKVESGVGSNLGSGSFPANMPLIRNQEAFLRITKALGIDPYKAPLSRAGAMGPAQIMPTTWEGMAPRIQQLMNKPSVNPYELSDAFVATGIFLADRGAQDPAQEAEALQKYVGGIYWQGQSWYSDKVLAVAKEYANEGL